MSLPSSAPKVLCTLSNEPLQAEGTVGSITSAFLSIDRTLVWAATGETIYLDPVKIPDTSPEVTFEVIPVDADGVFDLAGNMIYNWSYTLRVGLLLDEGQTKTVTYVFQPLTADGTVTLDLMPQVGAVSIPPATISGSEVSIVFDSGSLGGTP